MYANSNATLKVFAFNRTTNAPVLGDAANITCRVSVNGGARVALADTNPTELEDGYYLFNVVPSENNGATADFFPESSTANVQVIPVEHVRYLLTPLATGSGAITVTFTVLDSVSLTPLASALVTVTVGGVVYAYGRTNVSGQIQLALNAGTNSYSVVASGYTQQLASIDPSVTTSVTVNLVQANPVPPPSFAGLCNVLFAVTYNGNPVVGANVSAALEDENPTVDGYLLSRQITTGTTNASGEAVLTMVQRLQFTRGGVYRVRVSDAQGRVLHDRRVTVPNSSTVNAEDLPDAG